VRTAPTMVNFSSFKFPWQSKPPPVVVEPIKYAEPPLAALALFWVLPLLLCVTHGSIGLGQLVPRKLFSREDSTNAHKLLGFACLLHFLTRCPFLLDDMGFNGSLLTPACIVMHAALSVSSLIFHIPKVRIKEGSRIWPEFRLHSIVFACRSLACMMIVWVEERFDTGPHYLANVAVIFATLCCADAATNAVDEKSRSNTIRGLEMSPVYKYSFSLLQFLGTTGCLVGLRAYAAQFAIVFIIQTYAFTLTLRRKNLVTHQATVLIYASQLFLGVTVANLEVIRCSGLEGLFMFAALALAAGSLRMLLGLNKYLVWAIMSVIVQFARRCSFIVGPELRFVSWPTWGWPAAAAVMVAIFLGGIASKEARKTAAKAAAAKVA